MMPKTMVGILAGLFVFALLFAQATKAGAEIVFETSELTVVTASARHRFRVEIARKTDERKQGLMWRPSMESDAGMLFDYGREQPVAMWMKNTLIALDMLFIGADGRIINIARDAVPGSLKIIPSRGPALGVLELNGGTASRLKIRPGDLVEHEIFTGKARESAK